MAKGVIQASVLTADGSVTVAGGASVEIRDSATNALRTLYTDRTGSTTTGNPLTADSDGWFQVYADAGRVNVTADDGATTRTWNNVTVQDAGIEVSTLGTMITEDAADYPLLAGGADANFTLMPQVAGALLQDADLTADGSIKLASGLIVKWGSDSADRSYTATANETYPIAFPEAFPNANLFTIAGLRKGNQPSGASSTSAEALTASGFNAVYSGGASSTTVRFCWLAIGY